MSTKSFIASIDQIKQIITTYKLYQQNSKNPYIKFFAKTDNFSISIYTNNKVVIQGKNIPNNLNTNNVDCKNLSSQITLGSDEVGCGDIFGPVVACCVQIETKLQYQNLNKLGIRDSKKLTDKKIIELAQLIINNNLCKHYVYVLDNINYNNLIKTMNQNQLKMFVHCQARSKFDTNLPWIIDQFSTLTTLQKYQNNLFNDNLIKIKYQFNAQTKAENTYLSVAISSILARYYFLRKMYILSQNIGETLLLGASSKTLQQYNKIKLTNNMSQYAKLNFKSLK